ncbi:hypothetical protein [Paraglaciecola hydrolytica]|uniref:Uncharacterized protein n=1 Tax=Paraglaciecola hydrolytica TaxID=1799789 RepID=A0A148KM29_9ALTE|nr:hypothetical protein [Paraglaciecola hydrolytica]KXI27331.1 hypothetical protein AX660_21650 [Paraglaciecola hydrolytica]
MEQQKNDFLAMIEMSLAKHEMAEVWIKSIRSPENLSDTQIRMVESHWHFVFRAIGVLCFWIDKIGLGFN